MSEANDPFDAVPSDTAYQRPRLREELRIVYDNQGGTGSDTPRIRVVDPASGKQFSFDETEHFLCQQADGKSDLRAIHARLLERFGTDIPPRDVLAFFRRLHILGLLTAEPAEEPEKQASAPPKSGPRRRATPAIRRRMETGKGVLKQRAEPEEPKERAEPPTIPALRRRVRTTPELETPPAAPKPPADPAPETPRIATAGPKRRIATPGKETAKSEKPDPQPSPAAEPASSTSGIEAPSAEPTNPPAVAPAPAKARAASARFQRKHARKAASAQAGLMARRDAVSSYSQTESADPAPPGPHRTAATTSAESAAAETAAGPEKPKGRTSALTERSAAEAAKTTGGTSNDETDPLELIAGNLASKPTTTATARHHPGAFDDDADDFDTDDLQGGMGGGAGRMGGAMGGGMGGGGANRERLMAALAARKGGGGGGGMAAAMAGGAGGQQPAVGEKRPASLTLFNPNGLLKLLYVVFYPAKLILWMILPLVLLAGMSAFQNWPALLADHRDLFANYATLTMLVIGLFTVNLTSRLAQGVGIVAHGGTVRRFGIMLAFGALPRFFIDESAINGLDRKGQLWARAAPLLGRLAMFALGLLTWAILRDTGTWLPQLALIIGHFGLGMFLFTALPLIPADGQRWLATYLNEPRLLPKAVGAVRHKLTGRPLPQMIEPGDVSKLFWFGMATLITSVAVMAAVAAYLSILLEAELGGTGVMIFVGLVFAFALWLLAIKAAIGRRMAQAGGMAAGAAAVDPMLGRRVNPRADAEADPAATSGAAKVVWGVIGLGLLAVAWLPYDYDAGGLVEILPSARGQAVARIDGEILQINVREGDVVTQGQVLAQLSSWNQERAVSVARTRLDGAEAQLERLLAGPKPEEVALAQRQFDSAAASVAFSRAQAERNAELIQSGTVSQQAFERANASYESDLANLEVARASLDLVQSGATEEEISIAQAEVDQLRLELRFAEDELARTQIEAPMNGRVITADLALRQGSFLRVGEPLLEIEDSARVSAAIAIPESDITLVALGDPVRFKARGHADQEIEGTVARIAPAAQDAGYGSVIRVEALFDNTDDFLRSGMTGYAKVEGASMRVWEAYLRSIRRFFQVEVWSWIP